MVTQRSNNERLFNIGVQGNQFSCPKLCLKKLSTSASRIDFKFYMNITVRSDVEERVAEERLA